METEQINPNELELTELELNRIFFGSENSKIDISPSDDSTKEPEDHIEKNIQTKTISLKSSHPKKLERKPSIIKQKTKEENKKEDLTLKRKQGRPLKWTPEKIEQKKEENRQTAKLNRIKRQEALRIAQLSGDHPITEYEKRRRLDQVLKTKDEINQHITEKRNTLKAAINRKFVVILDQKTKCKEHLYKISHYEEVSKDPVGVCVYCSKIKQFAPADWKLYHSKNKDKL